MIVLTVKEPTLGQMLQQGIIERHIDLNLDFWFKCIVICCILSLLVSLLSKPSKKEVKSKPRRNKERRRDGFEAGNGCGSNCKRDCCENYNKIKCRNCRNNTWCICCDRGEVNGNIID